MFNKSFSLFWVDLVCTNNFRRYKKCNNDFVELVAEWVESQMIYRRYFKRNHAMSNESADQSSPNRFIILEEGANVDAATTLVNSETVKLFY